MNENNLETVTSLSSDLSIRENITIQLEQLLIAGNYDEAKLLLEPSQPVDIADAIGSLPLILQALAFRLLKKNEAIEVYESDIDRVFISQSVELSSENGGFQKNLKGKVIRISPQVKQRKVLSTDPTGDADSRIIEVLVKLDQDSIDIVQNYTGMKVIAKFIP